ncbi:MAG: PSD1 and planctomycete cytochrome C domain-containing protein [Gemmataceae bacterium]|nr:PSD1 and planctomycete cytochrome C domain-containing protein [Gemmataceae bacterium]
MPRVVTMLARLVSAPATVLGTLALTLTTASPAVGAEPTVDFNRDVRPILSDNCFRCHGPDEKERKAELRLDVRESAVGQEVIVPGKSGESELLRRITAREASQRMPPPSTGKQLSEAQIETLRRWIDEGASYAKHWAFVPPKRPAGGSIDEFIRRKLEAVGLTMSPEASRERLIRRVTLDLTGLPPTLAEIDAFVHDPSPDAYEKVVDRLLNSPRYGERMALDWLDAARFADTHGYHIDSGRDMTRWRDWVIDAFNRNLPFDQFTIEQLAGDLLPNATVEQKIASGFNRNHMINFEGGAIPEEYHTAYIVDRVNTTATVWLGLSLACAQCHDHKYDPFTQKDYYRLYAFFHNVPENGLDGSRGNAAPLLRFPTPEQQRELDRLAEEIARWQKLEKWPFLAKWAKSQQAPLQQQRDKLERQVPTTMVMQEMPRPRDTFILIRGAYDKKGEKVTAGLPEALVEHPISTDRPLNRLDLARWIVSEENPLTARVIVNRYWQMFFGTGLVKTSEDFGTQGEYPSHPELLDWLAVEFRESGWDVKRLVKMIVMSAAYRQDSRVRPEHLQKDPENRLLARASRLRLQAEFIRDQALAVSGLLNGEIGGRSVFPYQPPGLWEELMSRADGANWTAQTYTPSHGKDLYRRTMYTFWKRTCPPPTLATFDAPDREVCTVRRPRTNTPLQALILMNDPTYVEASRKLAERLLREADSTDERIRLAFRLCTGRLPNEQEFSILQRLFEDRRTKYRQDREAALKLLSVGESPRDEALPFEELAAWSSLASVILNLDETITRN